MTDTLTQTAQTTQLAAAFALTRILAADGLAEATWRINTSADLAGELEPVTGLDCRAEVRRYADALGLAVEPEHFVPNGPHSFVDVSASGVFDGVTVRVWAAVHGPETATVADEPAWPSEQDPAAEDHAADGQPAEVDAP